MITNPVNMIQDARTGHYGIGCFNIFDYCSAEAVINAAEETNTPVIVGILDFVDKNSEFSKFRMDDTQCLRFMAFLRRLSEMAKVPVAIHLDHCNTYEGCIRAIQWGATSVMLDASQKPFKENVALTSKVAKAARACNVAVEGEIGHIAGHPNALGEQYTSVEDAKAYYEATGVDMMAVSVGSVHGVLTSKPVLQYELMRQLREAVPCGLVMHGASGMTEEEYARSVDSGITKLNFASYLQIGMTDAMREMINAEKSKNLFAMEVNKAQIQGGVDIVTKHIGYFRTKAIA